jgi:flagellar basal-body rod protein FlgG
MSLRALSIAAGGSRALFHRFDVIAANLAQAGAPFAKRARAEFGGSVRLFEQGRLQPTSRELDLALEGDGFLRLVLPDGSAAFTRGGSFRLDAEGRLVSADGHLVDPTIVVPQEVTKISIDASGVVRGPEPDQTFGRLEIARFSDASRLETIGANLYRATPEAGDASDGASTTRVCAGHLEQSTIDPIRELMDLIQAQRAFEIQSRMIQAADDVLQGVNNLRRKA